MEERKKKLREMSQLPYGCPENKRCYRPEPIGGEMKLS